MRSSERQWKNPTPNLKFCSGKDACPARKQSNERAGVRERVDGGCQWYSTISNLSRLRK